MYVVRGLGGVMFLSGALIMVWNIWMTIRAGKPVTIATPARYAVAAE
jgi:cytochrome c oxidase cbb3-type subunit 1